LTALEIQTLALPVKMASFWLTNLEQEIKSAKFSVLPTVLTALKIQTLALPVKMASFWPTNLEQKIKSAKFSVLPTVLIVQTPVYAKHANKGIKSRL
jgi:hypothetical protein